ncbi:MAG: hypothetical protein RL427_463 [Bacteroidota bacterium]|jgi:hypothetical protein
MSIIKIVEYCQSIKVPITIEFYYKGNLIEQPQQFFANHSGLFENEFPSTEAIMAQIVDNHIYKETHKLAISEGGFHRIPL